MLFSITSCCRLFFFLFNTQSPPGAARCKHDRPLFVRVKTAALLKVPTLNQISVLPASHDVSFPSAAAWQPERRTCCLPPPWSIRTPRGHVVNPPVGKQPPGRSLAVLPTQTTTTTQWLHQQRCNKPLCPSLLSAQTRRVKPASTRNQHWNRVSGKGARVSICYWFFLIVPPNNTAVSELIIQ